MAPAFAAARVFAAGETTGDAPKIINYTGLKSIDQANPTMTPIFDWWRWD